MPNYSNRNKLDDLAEKAGSLVDEINRLNSETGEQIQGVARRQKRGTKVLALILALVVALVGVIVVLALTVQSTQDNTEEVNKITARLDYSQKVTRQKVLCPLYQIFVDSKSPEARKAYAKGPEEYDRIFVILQEAYDTIKCAEFKEKAQR